MTRHFSVVNLLIVSSFELNSDLAKISEWDFKWKMSFNPGPAEPAQEVTFSRS